MNSRELRTAALQAAVRGAESIDETQIQKAIDAIYEYGKASAGMPSYRGAYEAPVPEELKDEK